MGSIVQFAKRYTVPNAGSVRVPLPTNLALEQFTVWATSGDRTLTAMTVQPQMNEANFGSSTVFTAAKAAVAVYISNSTRDQMLIPKIPASQADAVDRLDFSILLSNAHTSPESVTIIFVGIQHQG